MVTQNRLRVRSGSPRDDEPPGSSTPAGIEAVGTWPDSLLETCTETIGTDLRYVERPTLLDQAHGPQAYKMCLETSSSAEMGRPAAESGSEGLTLHVRLAVDRSELDREAAAMRVSREHGSGATEVLGIERIEERESPDSLWALVSVAPSGITLPELIGFNLHHVDAILRGFAANHTVIHGMPIDRLSEGHSVPLIDAAREVARIDRRRFPSELRWLDEHIPVQDKVVLCHGGYQPMCVYGPPAAEWDAHGGPGRNLTVSNWSGAVLADREFDVAFTLVAFWSAAFFAKNRAERAAIKMIRNTLLNTYMLGYAGYEELDSERLRFWRAFHALRGMARLDDAFETKGSPFEAQDRGDLPDHLGPELKRYFQQAAHTR